MKKILALSLCIGILLLFGVTGSYCSSTQNWEGAYIFESSAGNTYGGSPILLESKLFISKDGGCRLEEDGFQTETRIICSIKNKKNGIDINFKSYQSGDTRNQYGVVVYKPNEKLFSLELGSSAGEIVTEFSALWNEDFAPKKRGTYYRKFNAAKTNN